MNYSSQNKSETKKLNCETSFGSAERAEMNDGKGMSTKDPDTMLSMIVLLLACLALAALAQVFVS